MAIHATGRRQQRAARDVIMALAWLQHWLFANHTFAVNQAHRPAPIRDPPMAGKQLDSLTRFVLNADVIHPEPLACLNPRLFGKEIHRDSHDQARLRRIDRITAGSRVFTHRSDCDMLEKFFHDHTSLAVKCARDNRELAVCFSASARRIASAD
jgi:hypothetical protein